MSYNFLTCEKHSIRFIETLRNYQQRNPLPKIFKMRQSLFADSFFVVNTAGIQHVIYTSEGDFFYLSLGAVIFCFLVSFQQFIFRSTSNQLAAWLFNKNGYNFSFHRSMMKEFTIVSNPDFQFQLLTFNNISQIFRVETPDNGCTIILLPRTINRTVLSFFISKRVTTKPRVKSLNVACTLGRMQSPLLIANFLSVITTCILA